MARIYLEFDDGHRVELQYDGDWIFFHPSDDKPMGDYLKNITPERLRKYGHIMFRDRPAALKGYMIHGVVHPSEIIKLPESQDLPDE